MEKTFNLNIFSLPVEAEIKKIINIKILPTSMDGDNIVINHFEGQTFNDDTDEDLQLLLSQIETSVNEFIAKKNG